MKKAIVFLAVALALPTGVALAKKPPQPPANGGKSAPKVTYVLKGTLSAYTAATATTTGSITIAVNHSNYHAKMLKGQSLTFTLTSTNSKVTFRHKSSLATPTATAKGVLTVRAPKKITGDLVTGLEGAATKIHAVVLKDLTA